MNIERRRLRRCGYFACPSEPRIFSLLSVNDLGANLRVVSVSNSSQLSVYSLHHFKHVWKIHFLEEMASHLVRHLGIADHGGVDLKTLIGPGVIVSMEIRFVGEDESWHRFC